MKTRHAVVVLAPEDTPEGRGRILHAFHTAQELAALGHETNVFFAGVGVTCLTAFEARDNQFTRHYGELFDEIHPLIAGACDFCARKRFDAAGASVAHGVDFVGGAGQHHSLAPLLLEDVTVSTF